MRRVPVLVSKASFDANPPTCQYHAMEIPGSSPTAVLVIADFHDAKEGRAWCAQPQCKPLLRGYALVPPIAVTLLGPPFGVVATDTIADAMEKVAVSWPIAWDLAH